MTETETQSKVLILKALFGLPKTERMRKREGDQHNKENRLPTKKLRSSIWTVCGQGISHMQLRCSGKGPGYSAFQAHFGVHSNRNYLLFKGRTLHKAKNPLVSNSAFHALPASLI